MISVLTLTYQRHEILEEAIGSFIESGWFPDSEMVIINDSPLVQYVPDDEMLGANIRVLNVPKRFDTIGEKLEFGIKQCKGNYVYRLDDDDLLAPYALSTAVEAILDNPGFDIYRSRTHYQFWDDKFVKVTDSINTGNVFYKGFINRIKFPKKTADEDAALIFELGASIYTIEEPTMIYRWNRNTYHISTGLHLPIENRLTGNTSITEHEQGSIVLTPKPTHRYYEQLP